MSIYPFRMITRQQWMAGLFALIGIAILAGGAFWYTSQQKPGTSVQRPTYEETDVGIVADKISVSAPIRMYLPGDLKAEDVQGKISFDPPIAGSVKATSNANVIEYKPERPLAVGTYYAVSLASPDGMLKDGFTADSDPRIEQIFPVANQEASEYSDITLIFNRPMVPLTTLNELSIKSIPVTIQPETAGTWKWITTRNLQFKPNDRLARSTTYTVKIGDLTSVEGLSVAAQTHTFTTRSLAYDLVTEGQIGYNEPFTITFNQPVDLDRLKSSIRIEQTAEKKSVEFDAVYGTKTVVSDGKSVVATDRSVVELYQQKDTAGRPRWWDFNTEYLVTVERAFPFEGDIILQEGKTAAFSVGTLIKDITATSEKSTDVSQDFFDPQGTLAVSFYEPIDLPRSSIDGDNVTSVAYGEKCKEPKVGEEMIEYDDPSQCEKEEDRSKIVVRFNSSALKRDAKATVRFKSVMSASGRAINPEPLEETVMVIPSLKVLSTNPKAGEKAASVTELSVCSTSPLYVPEKNELSGALTASGDIQSIRWSPSRLVYEGDEEKPCNPGQFHTAIDYGLVPKTAYQLTLNLKDVFGESLKHEISFTTGNAPDASLNFFHLQEKYTVTTPDKTVFTYAGVNMDTVNLHICKVSPERMIEYVLTNPEYTKGPQSLACEQSQTAVIDLPKKFWIKNVFKVDLKKYVKDPLGQYVLTYWNPKYKDNGNKTVYERSFASVTRLAVVEKKIDPSQDLAVSIKSGLSNLYWITETGSMKAAAGVTIEPYTEDAKNNFKKNAGVKTDGRGVAKVPVYWNQRGVIVSNGSDRTILVSASQNFGWTDMAQNAERVYLYSDRPIYKPGDEVQYKGLYRIGYDARYEVFQGKKAEVSLFDPSGQMIASQELSVNPFGTFNSKFTLDQHAQLGTYRIESLSGTHYFDVEEYKPAAFKVEATSDKEEYTAGDSFSLDVSAQYYFGAPVERGEVEYSIVSQDYYFDRYSDGAFDFGLPWYSCFDCPYGDQFILRGKAKLDEEGKAKVSHGLNFEQLFKGDAGKQSKIFVVYATVKNPSGQSVTAQHSFIVHRGEIYLGVKADPSFVGKNQQFAVRVKSVNQQGKETSVGSAKLTINRVTYRSIRRQEVDGGFYYKTEKVTEQIEEKEVSTDGSGNWQGNFTLAKEGEYEAVAKAKDGRKNPVQAIAQIYVYGEGDASVRPTNDTSLELETEVKSGDVGDQVTFIIKSPYKSAKALVSIERGRVFSYEIIDVTQNLLPYTFTISDEHVPNVYASVLLLAPFPEVKFGQVSFDVNTNKQTLKVKVSTDKQTYLPGEKVQLTVETKDFQDKPVKAEVSVAVVDMSVLALKGNPKKDPVPFFYAGFPLTVATASNIKNVLYEVEVPSGTKGGGGLEPDELAKRKRGIFKDTAYWEAVVQTDESGIKKLEFTLPDNLTTWQAETVALTQDTRLGVGYSELVSRKNVMVVPLLPRFILPGDTFLVGAKLFNQTKDAQRFDVSLASEDLTVEKSDPKRLTLAAGKTETLYFKATAPLVKVVGDHRLTLSAKSGDFEDTVEQRIPIRRNDPAETVATAGFSNANSIQEFVSLPSSAPRDRGGLTVKANATLAVYVTDALNYLASYPYGCSEQIASKMRAIAVLKRGLGIQNLSDKITLKPIEFEGRSYTLDSAINIGLTRMIETQGWNGGFAYYKDMEADFSLTLYVLETLNALKKAGVSVPGDAIERAATYVTREIMTNESLKDNKESVIFSAYVISQLDGFDQQKKQLIDRIIPYAKDPRLNEQASTLSLLQLALTFARTGSNEDLKTHLKNVLKNRVAIDGRGARMGLHKDNVMWSLYETSIKDTGLYLTLLSLEKDDDPSRDKLLRYLISARGPDGSWLSTNSSVAAIEGLTDYMLWKRENESDVSVALRVDGKENGKFDFNPKTIGQSFVRSIPLVDLPADKMTPIELSLTKHNQLTNTVYYDMALQYFVPVEKAGPRDEGISVTRSSYALDDRKGERPLSSAKLGDIVRQHITLTIPKESHFVTIEDYIPAGFEIVNFNLATEDQTLLRALEQDARKAGQKSATTDAKNEGRVARFFGWLKGLFSSAPSLVSGELVYEDTPKPGEMGVLVPDAEERHIDRYFFFKQELEPGVYQFDYFVRAATPGTFRHPPAIASEMYFPEHFGRTGGSIFEITN